MAQLEPELAEIGLLQPAGQQILDLGQAALQAGRHAVERPRDIDPRSLARADAIKPPALDGYGGDLPPSPLEGVRPSATISSDCICSAALVVGDGEENRRTPWLSPPYLTLFDRQEIRP